MRGKDVDAIAWLMIYSGLVAFDMHPGNRPGVLLSKNRAEVLDNLAAIADDAFERYARRFTDIYKE